MSRHVVGCSSRVARGAAALALAGASLLLVGLLGEVAVRLSGVVRRSGPPPGGARVLRTVPEIMRPYALGLYNGAPYRTNADGVRGPDYAPRAADGVFRLAVAGDSITMGSGVVEEDAYPARLAGLLDGWRVPARHEVVNLGVAGMSVRGIVERARRGVRLYHPALLVYGFTLNDIEGPFYRERERSAQRRHVARVDALSASRSHLVRLVGTSALFFWQAWNPVLDYTGELLDNYFDNPAAWASFREALADFAALAREEGVCGHLFVHPHLDRLGPDHPYLPIYERVAGAAREAGLGVTQPFARFAGADPGALRLSAVDTHPNPAGHAALAKALFDGLRALPASCWEVRPSAGRTTPSGRPPL
jgi:lysophospholipase L1-like esterase